MPKAVHIYNSLKAPHKPKIAKEYVSPGTGTAKLLAWSGHGLEKVIGISSSETTAVHAKTLNPILAIIINDCSKITFPCF